MTKFWLATHEATKNMIKKFFLAYEASESSKWFSGLLSLHSAVILEVTHVLVGDVLRFLNSMPIFVLYFLELWTSQGITFYQILYAYTSDS